jgi:hypothetical protein
MLSSVHLCCNTLYDSDMQAKELCEPLTSVDLRAVCLQRTEEQLAKQQYRQESAAL